MLKSSARCVAKSVNMDVMSGNLKNIPATDPHFHRVQCNPNMCFKVGNKNHDYKEKFLEILWGPNIAMSN